jgi:hypothetical protein
MKGPLITYLSYKLATKNSSYYELIEPTEVDAAERWVIETPDAHFFDSELTWLLLC